MQYLLVKKDIVKMTEMDSSYTLNRVESKKTQLEKNLWGFFGPIAASEDEDKHSALTFARSGQRLQLPS